MFDYIRRSVLEHTVLVRSMLRRCDGMGNVSGHLFSVQETPEKPVCLKADALLSVFTSHQVLQEIAAMRLFAMNAQRSKCRDEKNGTLLTSPL